MRQCRNDAGSTHKSCTRRAIARYTTRSSNSTRHFHISQSSPECHSATRCPCTVSQQRTLPVFVHSSVYFVVTGDSHTMSSFPGAEKLLQGILSRGHCVCQLICCRKPRLIVLASSGVLKSSRRWKPSTGRGWQLSSIFVASRSHTGRALSSSRRVVHVFQLSANVPAVRKNLCISYRCKPYNALHV